MSEAASKAPGRGSALNRTESGLLLLVTGLLLLTIFTGLSPAVQFAVLATDIDLLINGLAALVAGVAAWLSWLRQRHMSDPAAVYQAAAFATFALTAVIQTLADLGIGERELGLSLDDPRQAPLYAWSFLRVMAGGLLLRSAWLSVRAPASFRRPGIVFAASLGAAVAVAVSLYAIEPLLPPLLTAEALARVGAPETLVGPLPGITLLELALQAVAVILLAAAATGYAIVARRRTRPAAPYLAAGLVLAAFAQVHFAVFPGIYSGLVTSSDVLRICFYAFVLFGLQAEAGATLRELRSANRELRDLRDAELANASLVERARLAREIHDGLAQHLWLAKLASERLTETATPASVRATREELDGLLDAGLAEARQTVAALREASNPNATLGELLAKHVRRFGEETGLDATSNVSDTPAIPPRQAAELLRIGQEALNNVRKHADATRVDVRLAANGADVLLTVRDNGVGFDPAAEHSGYGLESMRERAVAAGGKLVVESSPQDGTLIAVHVPLPPLPSAGEPSGT
jgi:signal transduction histidine kinase